MLISSKTSPASEWSNPSVPISRAMRLIVRQSASSSPLASSAGEMSCTLRSRFVTVPAVSVSAAEAITTSADSVISLVKESSVTRKSSLPRASTNSPSSPFV